MALWFNSNAVFSHYSSSSGGLIRVWLVVLAPSVSKRCSHHTHENISELDGFLFHNIPNLPIIYIWCIHRTHMCIHMIRIYIYMHQALPPPPSPPPHGMGPIYWPHMRSSPSPPCGVVGVWYGMLGMYGVYGRSGMACLESMVCLVCMVGMVYIWHEWLVLYGW